MTFRKSILFSVAAFAVAAAATAAAGARALPECAAVAHFSRLTLSAEGRWVYAQCGGKLIVVPLRDPAAGQTEVALFNPMHSVQFSEHDTRIDIQSADGSFAAYRLSGDGVPAASLDGGVSVASSRWASENFDMYFPAGGPDVRWTGYAAKQIARSVPYRSGDVGFNARNIYGVVDGYSAVFLYRDRSFRMFAVKDGAKAVPFDVHGHAYYSRLENLRFKASRGRFLFAAHNSILTVGKARVRVVSGPDTEARFIEGDRPGQYYGWFSPYRVVAEGVPPALTRRIGAYMAQHAGIFVSGVSVNAGSDSFVVSRAAGLRTGHFDPADYRTAYDPVFCHYIDRAGQGRDTCATEPGFAAVRYSHRILSHGRALDRYEVDPARPTILYVHGGPDTDGTMISDGVVQYFLSAAFNVEVLNYAGASYSYPLAVGLSAEGLDGFRRNGAAVDDAVRLGHPHDPGRVTLVLESFGAQAYPFIRTATLKAVRSTVLLEPAGSVDMQQNTDTPEIAAMRRSIYGAATIRHAFFNAWYDGLTRCQLRSRTVLVTGTLDTRTYPGFDYRLCGDSPDLKVVSFPGRHGESYKYVLPDILAEAGADK